MLKIAMWAHGTTARVEAPERLTATEMMGDGATFHGQIGTYNWFHFAVPTPVVLDDRQQAIGRFFVMYETQGGYIRWVHLWDGVNKIVEFDGPGLPPLPTGYLDADQREEWNKTWHAAVEAAKSIEARYGLHDRNTFVLAQPVAVRWGLGISVGVNFETPYTNAQDSWITFASVGADFVM
jgi:hypothetical protein